MVIFAILFGVVIAPFFCYFTAKMIRLGALSAEEHFRQKRRQQRYKANNWHPDKLFDSQN